MQGSKYTDEQRQKFAAMMLAGMSQTEAARELGIPKSTASCWAQRLADESDEYAAERELERRKLVRRCMKITRTAVGAIDKQITAAAGDGKRIAKGLKVIAKAEKDGMIALTEEDVKALREIVSEYTGVGLRDLAATIKAMDEKQTRLEGQLGMGDASGNIQVTFTDSDGEDLAG